MIFYLKRDFALLLHALKRLVFKEKKGKKTINLAQPSHTTSKSSMRTRPNKLHAYVVAESKRISLPSLQLSIHPTHFVRRFRPDLIVFLT